MINRCLEMHIWRNKPESEEIAKNMLYFVDDVFKALGDETIDHSVQQIHTIQTMFCSYMYGDTVYVHYKDKQVKLPVISDSVTWQFDGTRNFIVFMGDILKGEEILRDSVVYGISDTDIADMNTSVSTNWAELHRQLELLQRYYVRNEDETLSKVVSISSFLSKICDMLNALSVIILKV